MSESQIAAKMAIDSMFSTQPQFRIFFVSPTSRIAIPTASMQNSKNTANHFSALSICPFFLLAKELVDEERLSFACDLRSARYANRFVRKCHDAFFHFHQPSFHAVLRRHVLACAVFNQIAIVSESVKQTFLTDIHAVLVQQLCKVSDKDCVVRRLNGFGEQNFGLVAFDLFVQ